MAVEPDPFEHTRMTLGQHLNELRKRLFRAALALFAAGLVSWYFYPQLTDIVLAPMHRALVMVDTDQVEKYTKLLAEERLADPSVPRTKYFASDDPTQLTLRDELTVSRRMVQIGPGEGFKFAIQVSLWGALVLGAPVMLWQMWQFIAAGLYPKERRAILKYFPISLLLFAAGVLFGYFYMCPYGFYFMVSVYAPEKIQTIPAIGPYLDLFQGVSLALGTVFELPLLMYALVRIGIVQRATFAKYRGHFVVVAFVVGGILTPPDPFTQFMLAVPMIALYELGLLWTRFIRKPQVAA